MHTRLCKWCAQQSAVCFLPPNCSPYLSTVCNTLRTLLHIIGHIRFYRRLLFSPFLVHMEEACTLSAGAPPMFASNFHRIVHRCSKPTLSSISNVYLVCISPCVLYFPHSTILATQRSETRANESRNLSLCEVRLLHSRAGELNLVLLENAAF